jgi:hypothetical protein
MPRVNRIERALNHPNPLTGCIMLVQERMRFLRRAVASWACPEYEVEILQLQGELSSLQEAFQAQRTAFHRLQQRSQVAFTNYRQRINTLLQANARHVSLRARQTLAFRAEITALRNTVRFLHSHIDFHGVHLPEYPVNTECPWEFVHNSRWGLSNDWVRRHPGQEPEYNPNDS